MIFEKLQRLRRSAAEWRAMDDVRINLKLADTAGNDPYYARVVRDFYATAMRRHHRFPLVRQYKHGFCVYHMTADGADYARAVESSARRNQKKALRLGYKVDRLDFNRHLDDVTAIRASTPVRQGRPMPEGFATTRVRENTDPPSRSATHDYPFFGVFLDGKVYAYASCLIAGELASIESIYGHADRLADGVVPLLIIGMAQYIAEHHPDVRYFAYGTYFGATDTMKRFKRKFQFHPHRVHWQLG